MGRSWSNMKVKVKTRSIKKITVHIVWEKNMAKMTVSPKNVPPKVLHQLLLGVQTHVKQCVLHEEVSELSYVC